MIHYDFLFINYSKLFACLLYLYSSNKKAWKYQSYLYYFILLLSNLDLFNYFYFSYTFN